VWPAECRVPRYGAGFPMEATKRRMGGGIARRGVSFWGIDAVPLMASIAISSSSCCRCCLASGFDCGFSFLGAEVVAAGLDFRDIFKVGEARLGSRKAEK